ncbi:MAG: calcium-binding protein, partial [Microgenomates group bacterium]
MKKILKILLIIIGIFFLISSRNKFRSQIIGKTAQAVGDLTINWGVPAGTPIFMVENFMPGETIERSVTILNGASSARPVGVVGVKTEELKDLANVLEITISQNGTVLYGGSLGTKTLAQFFQESTIPNAIFLFNLNPGESKQVKFKAKFQERAGNTYQKAKVVFDIILGLYYQVPEECKDIKFSGSPIFGTQRNDVLRGTNGNDLIFGFGGNDRIEGSNGNDCLVGGAGNDRIFGSNGDDVMLGNEANDYLDGSNGNDRIFGGEGNDIVNAGNGNDYVEGNEGNDNLRGGNGN